MGCLLLFLVREFGPDHLGDLLSLAKPLDGSRSHLLHFRAVPPRKSLWSKVPRLTESWVTEAKYGW